MRTPHPTLTPQELAIMKVVWRLEKATVRDVFDTLRARRAVAYTTIMTMMKILEEKGYLLKSRAERAYVYRPARPRTQVVGAMVRDFVDRVFDGAAGSLILHLAKDRRLSKDERADDPPHHRGDGAMIDDRTLLNLLAWWSQIALVVAAAAALPRLLRLDDPGTRPLVLARPARVVSGAAARGTVADVRSALCVRQIARPHRSPANRPPRFRAALPCRYRPSSPVKALSYFWLARLIALFAIVAVARLIWLAIGIKRLGRLLDGAAVTPDEVIGNRDALPAVSTAIRYVPNISQPITFGVRRPVVCLPERLRGNVVPTSDTSCSRTSCGMSAGATGSGSWPRKPFDRSSGSTRRSSGSCRACSDRAEEVVDELTVLETNARRTYLQALLTFADGPVPFPVTPFARRRHLFHRIQLISREAVMSSKRFVVSSAVIVLVVASVTAYGASRFPLTAISSAAIQTPEDSAAAPTAAATRSRGPEHHDRRRRERGS